MSLLRPIPPYEIAAQCALAALILRGAWALCGLPIAPLARRDAAAVGLIAGAFALHRLALQEHGGGSIRAGVERLRLALAPGAQPILPAAEDRTAALLALAIPAALLLAAAWISLRPRAAQPARPLHLPASSAD